MSSRKTALLVILLGSILAEILIGFTLWRFTSFLEPELINEKQMRLGDTRGMTFLERAKIRLIWTPFVLVIAGFATIQIRLGIDLATGTPKFKDQNNNRI